MISSSLCLSESKIETMLFSITFASSWAEFPNSCLSECWLMLFMINHEITEGTSTPISDIIIICSTILSLLNIIFNQLHHQKESVCTRHLLLFVSIRGFWGCVLFFDADRLRVHEAFLHRRQSCNPKLH